MPCIHFIPDDISVEINGNETILSAALRAGIPHTHVCGGNARCTTCRIMILDDVEACISPRNEKETLLADRLGFGPIIRLACQTYVKSDVRVRRLVLDNSDIELTKLSKTPGSVTTVGVEKSVTILFADIRNFTAFSEKQLPYDVIHLLNRYFHKMREIIERNHGYINNYMGDGLLALFGVYDPLSATEYGVSAGLEMLQAMDDLQPYIEQTYNQKLQMGVGVHCGEVVIGSIGNSDREKRMVIGDAVNVASRIESCNKSAGTRLLVSEAVYEQLKDKAGTD